jgi:hypothetical protein
VITYAVQLGLSVEFVEGCLVIQVGFQKGILDECEIAAIYEYIFRMSEWLQHERI